MFFFRSIFVFFSGVVILIDVYVFCFQNAKNLILYKWCRTRCWSRRANRQLPSFSRDDRMCLWSKTRWSVIWCSRVFREHLHHPLYYHHHQQHQHNSHGQCPCRNLYSNNHPHLSVLIFISRAIRSADVLFVPETTDRKHFWTSTWERSIRFWFKTRGFWRFWIVGIYWIFLFLYFLHIFCFQSVWKFVDDRGLSVGRSFWILLKNFCFQVS